MDDSPATAALRTRARGRAIVLASACASIAVLAVAAWVGRGWLVETWYLHRLGSTDEETWLAAAEKLGDGIIEGGAEAAVLLIGDKHVASGGLNSLMSRLFVIFISRR